MTRREYASPQVPSCPPAGAPSSITVESAGGIYSRRINMNERLPARVTGKRAPAVSSAPSGLDYMQRRSVVTAKYYRESRSDEIPKARWRDMVMQPSIRAMQVSTSVPAPLVKKSRSYGVMSARIRRRSLICASAGALFANICDSGPFVDGHVDNCALPAVILIRSSRATGAFSAPSSSAALSGRRSDPAGYCLSHRTGG